MKNFKKIAVLCLFVMMFCMAPMISAVNFVKVVLVGDTEGGKTGIYNRLKDYRYYHTDPSQRFQYFQEVYGDFIFKIWDTPGMEKYYDRVVDFLDDANVVFIVHDLSKKYGEDRRKYLDKIYKSVKGKIASDGKIVFVGSKSDKETDSIYLF